MSTPLENNTSALETLLAMVQKLPPVCDVDWEQMMADAMAALPDASEVEY